MHGRITYGAVGAAGEVLRSDEAGTCSSGDEDEGVDHLDKDCDSFRSVDGRLAIGSDDVTD